MTAENAETADDQCNADQCKSVVQVATDIQQIFEFLSHNNKIVFKSQQIDDPELQYAEKVQLAQEVFQRNRQTFLMRFGAFLEQQHLCAFAEYAICEGVSPPLHADENYDEMQFMLHALQRKLQTRTQDVKNRRYAAMQKLIKDGDYFSELEMMKRAPELYQELIGQYMSEIEKKQRDAYDVRNTSFSGILMHTMQQQQMQQLLQQADEENEIIEEDTATVAHIEESPEEEKFEQQWGSFENEPVPVYKPFKKSAKAVIKKQQRAFISPGERDLLRQEFMGIMQQQFLTGEDADFNYQDIDEDSTLDDISQLNQDKEDAYFDESSDEEIDVQHIKQENAESEDELDIYMSHLKRHHSLQSN